jgi:hypothetical protein
MEQVSLAPPPSGQRIKITTAKGCTAEGREFLDREFSILSLLKNGEKEEVKL